MAKQTIQFEILQSIHRDDYISILTSDGFGHAEMDLNRQKLADACRIHTYTRWCEQKRAQTEMNLRCRNDCCAVAQRTRRTHTNAGYRIRTKWNKRWTTPWDCVRVCEQRNFADLPTKGKLHTKIGYAIASEQWG